MVGTAAPAAAWAAPASSERALSASLAHDLLNARHKAVVRARNGRLLNLELGRHRTAGTNEAHVVQALLGAKIELLGAHVQAVQAVNPRLAGTGLDILVGTQAVVEQ